MIRKSTIEDVRAIHKLLQIYGDQGELLPRPLSKIYDHVRDFWVFFDPEKGRLAGCCALQFHWDDLAEIRSLAVHPDYTKQKIGTALTHTVLDDARAFGIPKVFTLTYRPGFFEQFGFKIIHKADLPLKIWADCITCVKFPDCDEIAMIREMDELTD